MKDTIAFAIVKELKAKGYDVKTYDAPKPTHIKDPKFPGIYGKDNDDLAVVGGKDLLAGAAVEACVTACRRHIHNACDGYTIAVGTQNKQFPGAPFAAW